MLDVKRVFSQEPGGGIGGQRADQGKEERFRGEHPQGQEQKQPAQGRIGKEDLAVRTQNDLDPAERGAAGRHLPPETRGKNGRFSEVHGDALLPISLSGTLSGPLMSS